MLFIGLGTGLGSDLDRRERHRPLELGRLRFSKTQKLGDVLGRAGMEKIGKKAWREIVAEVVHEFLAAFEVDYVVLGGVIRFGNQGNPDPGAPRTQSNRIPRRVPAVEPGGRADSVSGRKPRRSSTPMPGRMAHPLSLAGFLNVRHVSPRGPFRCR